MHLMEGERNTLYMNMSHIKSIFYAHPYIITFFWDKHVNFDFPNRPLILDTSVRIVVPCSHSLDSFDRDVYQLFDTQLRMSYYFSFIILDVHISGGTLMRMAYYFSFKL